MVRQFRLISATSNCCMSEKLDCKARKFDAGLLVLHFLQLALRHRLGLQLLDLLVDRLLHLLRRLAGLGDAAKFEQAFVLPALVVGEGGGGDLLFEDQRLVQPPGAVVQQAAENQEGGLVLMAIGDGVKANPHFRVGFGGGSHALLAVLRLLDGADRIGLPRAALQAAEILLRQLDRLGRVEIADQAGGEIVGRVILAPKYAIASSRVMASRSLGQPMTGQP